MFVKNRHKLTACVSLLLAVQAYTPHYSLANELNTATIMASSASPSCFDYKISGACFWLFCTPFGCVIRSSIKVKHFSPDMVISVYNHEGQNPWSEMNLISLGIKGGEYRSPQKHYSQFTFKNATAIGHPQGAILGVIGNLLKNTEYYCQNQTKPFVPYFLSHLDYFAWRFGMPEMFYPESITPGLREVRASGDLWGNVYPRSGSVTQVHDYKAAAVIAQRVADIVTRQGQLHIYQPSARGNSPGFWHPQPVKEGNAANHKWQKLYPQMSLSCGIFPDNPPATLSKKGNYAWALWRPYSCCKRRGQIFLGSTDLDIMDWNNNYTP